MPFPKHHHLENECVVFEGVFLFSSTSTTPPSSKPSACARFRGWLLVHHHHHTLETERVCSVLREVVDYHHHLPRNRACMLVFEVGWLLSYHHHLTTLENECAPSFLKAFDHRHPPIIESEHTCSFLMVVGLLPLPPPLENERLVFEGGWLLSYHHHLTTFENECAQNRARLLGFEGGWLLFTTTTTPPPSKLRAFAQF